MDNHRGYRAADAGEMHKRDAEYELARPRMYMKSREDKKGNGTITTSTPINETIKSAVDQKTPPLNLGSCSGGERNHTADPPVQAVTTTPTRVLRGVDIPACIVRNGNSRTNAPSVSHGKNANHELARSSRIPCNQFPIPNAYYPAATNRTPLPFCCPSSGPYHPGGNGGCCCKGMLSAGIMADSYKALIRDKSFFLATCNGIIQLKLREGVEVQMTLDGSVQMLNWRCNIAMSLSSSSSNSAALIHPNGRVLQLQSRVEIMAYDGKKANRFVRFAKIWSKGISFTSEENALVYLVDAGGTRTTTDTFMDIRNNIVEQVFLTGAIHGPAYDNQAQKEVAKHKYWQALDGTEIHELNGFRVAQTLDGMVRITKEHRNTLLRTSPGNGSATLNTTSLHCTASLGESSHLFVRRGERRMHFDGAEFVVRNSGHSAGFTPTNLLRIY